MDGTCGTLATLGNEWKNFVLKPEGKRPVTARLMWEDNFNTPHTNCVKVWINPYPTAFPYGNGMVLHFYQQQESSTTKTVHRVINKGLKTYV